MAGNRKKGSKRVRRRKKRSSATRYYDYNLLAIVILLTCFGLVMLYSTSAYEAQVNHGNDMYYFGRQAAISAACIIAVVVFSQMDYHFYARFAGLIYIVANILLVATRFIGKTINGARRWIYIGSISFQPAEMAKLAIILFLPVFILNLGREMRNTKGLMKAVAIGAIPAFFAYEFTDNASTAIIIAGIVVILMIVTYPKAKPYIIGGTAALAVGVVGVRSIVGNMGASDNNWRFNRILVWLDPELYAREGGYQIMQALYAIGSGGFFGKGLGNSTQKLGAVPEAQNDMIFSIICEELGVFGATMITLMFIFLLYRLLFIAQNAPDLLGSLIVTGIFGHIALQVVFNIAVVLNVIPTTGVTLPFVSYGGTSIAFLMAEMALALSVSRQIEFQNEAGV